MNSEKLLHVANFSTLFVCMVLKFPQIFVLIRAKSTTGISINSLLLELTGFIVFVTYQMYYDYPPPTYLEYPILIAQDVILLLLILHYNGSLKQSLIYAIVFLGGWQLLTVEKWIIDLAMSLCTFISAGSKFAQLQCLWQSKDSGQVSALSWAMATYTCFARIYTTTVTTGDMQVLVRFIIMTVLNSWVLATVLYYKKHAGDVQKKQE
ncbi:solute carrier family 66 member 3 [Esox lucius]|uniref:Solute carrier family 66 member 3 n=1 Tax=Esox lucius TaxID=8010 RepID=C1BXJ8_ESOLU|nr:solute carrier family 66 member 3 [Esox lucius]ACO13751.1 PQ loop repeat-containing protein 3 precursor [Esox lucius]